ncbi:putative phage holin [uncultured phage cr36_1]|uniref:Phage holin n=1 Tax=uncultured phage cr36_1 TaxID=2986397 RepID=A0AAE7RZW2_9CAUD|nr:putative phage holin [uncultured phage cr36_1]QWM89497.1 putative phage holin [uncultured phage cr36_1]
MKEIIESALNQGLSSLITISIFLLLYKWLDNKKKTESEKFVSSIGDTLDEVSKSLLQVSTFITDITKNIIDKDKDKCKTAIDDAMLASAMRLTIFVTNTVINNHVQTNKDNILANIHNIVNAEFYTVFSSLSLYKINGVKVSDNMKKDWMPSVEKSIIEIVFNNNLSKEDKISSFNNKINLKFQSYITYITNNTLK